MKSVNIFKLKTFGWSVVTALICSLQGSVIGGENLKSAYDGHFLVGAALNQEQIESQNLKALSVVKTHFNTATAENEMKWERIHPEARVYDFSVGDALLELGDAHGLAIIGHTLVWHQQTPDWVFQDESGEEISRDALIVRMEDHIKTLVTRYRGRIHGWDVVNEAFEEDGSWRDSPWYRIIGPDFIELAFRFAKEADPEVALYYNDYNLFKAEKRDAVVRLVKDLKSKGVEVDGVGIQGHYALGYPSLKQLEKSITAFGQLGVEVMITELDVSVLPFPDSDNMGADVSLNFELKDEYDPYPDGLPKKVEKQLGKAYEGLFRLFLKHSDVVSRVTFWGVGNADSWRNGWPMSGRVDYPLLFDREYKELRFVEDLIQLP